MSNYQVFANKEAILAYALRIIALDYKYQIPYGYKPYEFAQLVLEFVKEDLDRIPDEMVIQQFESDLMNWLKLNRMPGIEQGRGVKNQSHPQSPA